jgi:hypothetical protein
MHIRPLPFFLFAAVLAAQAPTETLPPAAPASLEPPAAMTTIGKDELLKHASFLASDELQGRLTGSPGQLAAATYIQKHFAALGLEPLGDEKDGVRGWHQDYGVRRTYVTTDTKLAFGGLALTDGFAVLGGQAQQVAEKHCPADEGADHRGAAQQVSPGVGGAAAQQQYHRTCQGQRDGQPQQRRHRSEPFISASAGVTRRRRRCAGSGRWRR